jgi:nucleotide-binding universal stress UspA family protein
MAHLLPLVNTITPEAATRLRATKSELETQFLTNCFGTVYRLPSTEQEVEGSLMHVLVATDGKTDTDEAAKFAHAIAGSEGSTTVLTVVPIPRQLVSELREQWGETPGSTTDIDAEYVGAPGGERTLARSFPGDDAIVDQYLGNKRVELCKPIVDAIRALGGAATSHVEEGHEISASIMKVATADDVDVIVIGSHGGGAFQGLLGSTGSKLVRRAKHPVLVLR